MFHHARDYVSIQDEEDYILKKELLPHHVPISTNQTFWTRYWIYFTHGILMLFSAIFLGLWVHARNNSLTLSYSPANEAVEYYKGLRAFNGTFNYSSIYRGTPSPELDAAWLRVSKGVPGTRITKEQLQMLGEQDSPSKVKYREEEGGGYLGALEVTHQLHCLNVLRKYLYLDYYGQFDPFFTETTQKNYRMHLEHCIDNLRQVLMCSADVGIITYEWVRGFSIPYPNFNTKHKCRNFEKVIDWGMTHAARTPLSHLVRLDGEVDLSHGP